MLRSGPLLMGTPTARLGTSEVGSPLVRGAPASATFANPEPVSADFGANFRAILRAAPQGPSEIDLHERDICPGADPRDTRKLSLELWPSGGPFRSGTLRVGTRNVHGVRGVLGVAMASEEIPHESRSGRSWSTPFVEPLYMGKSRPLCL